MKVLVGEVSVAKSEAATLKRDKRQQTQTLRHLNSHRAADHPGPLLVHQNRLGTRPELHHPVEAERSWEDCGVGGAEVTESDVGLPGPGED